MIYRYKENAYPQYMAFRIKSGQENQAMALINSEWAKISEGKPIGMFNVADRFNSMYGEEERMSKIIGAFLPDCRDPFVFWVACIRCPVCFATNQRNWRQKGEWRNHFGSHSPAQPRFCEMGGHRLCNCCAHCLVLHEQMARKLRL